MTPQLSSSIALAKLLAEGPPISTTGNVNIVDAGDEGKFPLCYLPYLISFTKDGNVENSIGEYEGLAAIFLAAEHLNTGNGTIVPELAGLDQRCPLRFTTEAHDSESQASVGMDRVIKLTERGEGRDGLLPAAIVGAGWSSISMPTSIISSLRGFPQISPISTSTALDDKSKYKLFGRTIPNDDGTAIPLIAKLNLWEVRYVAILYLNDSYGNAFAKGITLAAQIDAPDLSVVTVSIPVGADNDAITKAIQQLKETEYMFFFGIIEPTDDFVSRVMTEAYRQEIAGTGLHTWIFSDAVGSAITQQDLPLGSQLERAFRGTGRMSAVGGMPGMDKYDLLSASLRQIGASTEDIALLDAHLPRDGADFLAPPGILVPFLYDAVVALGLASCRLVGTPDAEKYFTGDELFQALLDAPAFNGTSGSIVLDQETGSRDPRSALFLLTNFVRDEEASLNASFVRFKAVETDLFTAGSWDAITPYTFNDGTDEIPLDLPVLHTNANYLSTGLMVVGLILCTIIVALALGFSFWTYANSKRTIVTASQPLFLYIITAGTMLMGLSIIPLTIGERGGDQMETACMALPWMLAIGFTAVFSALFTKTNRIYQIIKSAKRFKTVVVSATDVMKPMFFLFGLNVIVLTVWSIIDPLEREVFVVSQDSFSRNTETYSVCGSEHPVIFLALLCSINLGSLLVAMYQAFKARNISTELQESSFIFMAIVLVSVVLFLGTPVMIIASDNVAAYYFVGVGIVFAVCCSILLLIFVPKVRALKKKEGNNGTTNQLRSSTTSHTYGLRILSSPQAELEQENNKLKQQLASARIDRD